MERLEHTVVAYRESCDGVMQRIAQLNREINKCKKSNVACGELIRRRYFLYVQQAELLGDIREMEDYIKVTQRQ